MHNLKEIRKNFDDFQKDLKKRNVDVDLNNLKNLDKQNRELIQNKEGLEKEKKDISNLKINHYLKSQKKFLLKLKK